MTDHEFESLEITAAKNGAAAAAAETFKPR
jgi:hypothetical protein